MKPKLVLFLILTHLSIHSVCAQITFLDQYLVKTASIFEMEITDNGNFLIANSYKDDINQFHFNGLQVLLYDECSGTEFGKHFTVPNYNLTLEDMIISSDGFYYLMGYFFDNSIYGSY